MLKERRESTIRTTDLYQLFFAIMEAHDLVFVAMHRAPFGVDALFNADRQGQMRCPEVGIRQAVAIRQISIEASPDARKWSWMLR
jgi:hypothetical protein